MLQLEHIDAIERRLWSAADTLRANSKYASNEYFLPVMGLVFLRHAYSRYLTVNDEIAAGLPTRGGRTRPLTREDFAQKSAIFLRQEAQFDYIVALPDGEDRAAAIIAAMESIEADYDSLRGVLPKSEYQALDNEVLGDLLRKLNPDELKQVSGEDEPRRPRARRRHPAGDHLLRRPAELLGRADYVMANPPFNVDEISPP